MKIRQRYSHSVAVGGGLGPPFHLPMNKVWIYNTSVFTLTTPALSEKS